PEPGRPVRHARLVRGGRRPLRGGRGPAGRVVPTRLARLRGRPPPGADALVLLPDAAAAPRPGRAAVAVRGRPTTRLAGAAPRAGAGVGASGPAGGGGRVSTGDRAGAGAPVRGRGPALADRRVLMDESV